MVDVVDSFTAGCACEGTIEVGCWDETTDKVKFASGNACWVTDGQLCSGSAIPMMVVNIGGQLLAKVDWRDSTDELVICVDDKCVCGCVTAPKLTVTVTLNGIIASEGHNCITEECLDDSRACGTPAWAVDQLNGTAVEFVFTPEDDCSGTVDVATTTCNGNTITAKISLSLIAGDECGSLPGAPRLKIVGYFVLDTGSSNFRIDLFYDDVSLMDCSGTTNVANEYLPCQELECGGGGFYCTVAKYTSGGHCPSHHSDAYSSGGHSGTGTVVCVNNNTC